jgi:hypothetical protein
VGLEATGGECLIPETRVPFDNIGARVANLGRLSPPGWHLLFALMLLTMIAEIFLVIMRAYS